jgi:hypothetical protein
LSAAIVFSVRIDVGQKHAAGFGRNSPILA